MSARRTSTFIRPDGVPSNTKGGNMANAYDLVGRIAMITGASSGIGEQLARSFARSGAAVVLAARRKERLDRLEQEIRASGGKALAVEMDVANEASIIAGYDAAQGELGVVDTVVANAGMTLSGPATKLSADRYDEVLRVNVRGTWLTAREGARRMITNNGAEKRNGRMVLMSSASATKVLAMGSAYSVSKAAVSHMARILALEWIDLGINVNAVLPGMIRTEMTGAGLDTERGQAFIASLPRQREMDLCEIEDAVLMLCSDGASAITGTEICVDDGQNIMV